LVSGWMGMAWQPSSLACCCIFRFSKDFFGFSFPLLRRPGQTVPKRLSCFLWLSSNHSCGSYTFFLHTNTSTSPRLFRPPGERTAKLLSLSINIITGAFRIRTACNSGNEILWITRMDAGQWQVLCPGAGLTKHIKKKMHACVQLQLPKSR
jgi:hypothetical protein